MPFVAVTLFLVLYYIRPQEWIGFFSTIQPVRLVMLFGLASLLLRFRGLALKDLFQTPHDWAIAIFFGYVIWFAPDSKAAFDDLLQYMIFYIVIVQALSGVAEIKRFLWIWSLMILWVASMALLSLVGFDPMGSFDITQWRMKGRLVLNTSIFSNPNALGHSVVPLVALLYYQLFWKRPIFVKEVFIALVWIPLLCVYETESKGAFIAGFATMVVSLTLGFPRWLQVAFVALALSAGTGLLQNLPRMDTLDRDEAGIEGRIRAFSWGWKAMQEYENGIGYRQWYSYIASVQPDWPISTHSSYNQIGSELGKPGLFLYLGLLVMCARTLLAAKPADDEEERIRRLLFTLLLSFGLSSWMIDWGYRATLFMMLAATGAFHRQMLRGRRDISIDDEVYELSMLERMKRMAGMARAVPLKPAGSMAMSSGAMVVVPEVVEDDASSSRAGAAATSGIRWRKIGLIDILLTYALYRIALYIWYKAITTFF